VAATMAAPAIRTSRREIGALDSLIFVLLLRIGLHIVVTLILDQALAQANATFMIRVNPALGSLIKSFSFYYSGVRPTASIISSCAWR
jgi:hypothetical protein